MAESQTARTRDLSRAENKKEQSQMFKFRDFSNIRTLERGVNTQVILFMGVGHFKEMGNYTSEHFSVIFETPDDSKSFPDF